MPGFVISTHHFASKKYKTKMTTNNSLLDVAKESTVESTIPAKYAYVQYLTLVSCA